jgi:methylase of polypeptide subunit release factors
MRFVTTIIKEAADHLAGGGWLAVEMDPDQTAKAMKLMEQSGRYSTSERVKDYSRRYRVVMAQKR